MCPRGQRARLARCVHGVWVASARYAPCGLSGAPGAAWGAPGYPSSRRGAGVVQRTLRGPGEAVGWDSPKGAAAHVVWGEAAAEWGAPRA
jgi:hypothetical protein